MKAKRAKILDNDLFEDDYPLPEEDIVIHDIGFNNHIQESIMPMAQFCPITISIGIQSGQIILDPSSRSYLTRLGYVFPLPSDEVVYH